MISNPRTAHPILIKLIIEEALGLSGTLNVARTAALE
jgi:hypothetical protein